MINEQFYTDTLKEYKTTEDKQVFLKRSINRVTSILTDQMLAFSGPGYLLGGKVTALTISETRNELIVLNRLYFNL